MPDRGAYDYECRSSNKNSQYATTAATTTTAEISATLVERGVSVSSPASGGLRSAFGGAASDGPGGKPTTRAWGLVACSLSWELDRPRSASFTPARLGTCAWDTLGAPRITHIRAKPPEKNP